MVANKTRIAIGLGSTLVLAGVGYSTYEIKEHPEKFEFFLEGYPDFIPTIDKYDQNRLLKQIRFNYIRVAGGSGQKNDDNLATKKY